MSKDLMTTDRFAEILSAYGGDAARWPAQERPAAEQLLRRSDAARHLLAGETGLDALLGLVPEPAPAGAALHDRIVDIAAAGPSTAPTGETSLLARLQEMWRGFGALRPAGAALATSLMLGVVFGGTFGPAGAEPEPIDIIELALLDLTFTGY